MKALVQRVVRGAVSVGGVASAEIGKGSVILLGIRQGDTPASALALAEKCAHLRVFDDGAGKMNLALAEVGGSALVISQFTLYGDAQRGHRPGFTLAARPDEAEPLYEQFVAGMRAILGTDRVRTGVFRAMMEVTIVNDGPVTILLEHPNP